MESARTHEFSINVAFSVYLFKMARRKNIVGWNEMRHEKQNRGRSEQIKKNHFDSIVTRRWRKLKYENAKSRYTAWRSYNLHWTGVHDSTQVMNMPWAAKTSWKESSSQRLCMRFNVKSVRQTEWHASLIHTLHQTRALWRHAISVFLVEFSSLAWRQSTGVSRRIWS